MDGRCQMANRVFRVRTPRWAWSPWGLFVQYTTRTPEYQSPLKSSIIHNPLSFRWPFLCKTNPIPKRPNRPELPAKTRLTGTFGEMAPSKTNPNEPNWQPAPRAAVHLSKEPRFGMIARSLKIPCFLSEASMSRPKCEARRKASRQRESLLTESIERTGT